VQFAREDIRVVALWPGPIGMPPLEELFANDPKAPGEGAAGE
jgi:hypothetical protein